MQYAKRILWLNPQTPICTLHEDGTVVFNNDPQITEDALKMVVTELVKESEVRRQKILDAMIGRIA